MKRLWPLMAVLIILLLACAGTESIIQDDGEGNALIRSSFIGSELKKLEAYNSALPLYYSLDTNWLSTGTYDKTIRRAGKNDDEDFVIPYRAKPFFIFQFTSKLGATGSDLPPVRWLIPINSNLEMSALINYPPYHRLEPIRSAEEADKGGPIEPDNNSYVVKFVVWAEKLDSNHELYKRANNRYDTDSIYLISWDVNAFKSAKVVTLKQFNDQLQVVDSVNIENIDGYYLFLREGRYIWFFNENNQPLLLRHFRSGDLERHGLALDKFGNDYYLKVVPLAKPIIAPKKPRKVYNPSGYYVDKDDVFGDEDLEGYVKKRRRNIEKDGSFFIEKSKAGKDVEDKYNLRRRYPLPKAD